MKKNATRIFLRVSNIYTHTLRLNMIYGSRNLYDDYFVSRRDGKGCLCYIKKMQFFFDTSANNIQKQRKSVSTAMA